MALGVICAIGLALALRSSASSAHCCTGESSTAPAPRESDERRGSGTQLIFPRGYRLTPLPPHEPQYEAVVWRTGLGEVLVARIGRVAQERALRFQHETGGFHLAAQRRFLDAM